MKKHLVYTVAAALTVSTGFGIANGRSAANVSDISQNMSILGTVLKELNTNYVDTIDAGKTMRYAIDAMLEHIDPYTVYYSFEEQEEFSSISSGEFSGIGCTIMQRDGHIELSGPTWDSPSRRAGVRHGDILIAIDGDTLPKGFTSSEASKRLRGPAGTTVNITVKRPYTTDSIKNIEIVRGTIKSPAVPYYGMQPGGVGYIKLTAFNEHSAKDVRNALTELMKGKNLKSLVLDLRDNGGGLVESAVQIAGLFVPKGTEIVRTRYRDNDNDKVYVTTQKPIAPDLPLAILVNDGTASASEIVAGSMQDLDRAVIIGQRSFGKGLVQTSRELPYEGILKITVARYYIPSGRLIQAIDYSHRNPDGSVARIPDSLTNVFHTRAGREVRDGGGITPDVKIEPETYNRMLYNIVADMWSYDYANRFRERQGSNMPAAADFEVTDSIFNDFKAFIDPDRFKYDRLCETGLQYLREAAELEGYSNDEVNDLFSQLEVLLKHNLDQDLEFNKADINEILDNEISERYYSEADQVMRALRYDNEIKRAIEILTDTTEYQNILNPKKP